ncbi:hypothetical protein NUW58_g9057 [Xylaria curta]|uniref:Uncharacterized protein n=1 Tax=Xylaria curta TaxID=42375 RepID=A0ACC1N143_9PEZI|nr:hypothetical protein NUW58_g9057 [Xylaria curta]
MSAGRVVLVTGASNGIGYETVKAFLKSPNPYYVYLGSRSLEKGKAVLEQIHAECPDTTNAVELIQIDLGSDESIERTAFEVVKNGQGRLDVLINNAGGGFDLDFMQGKMSLRESFNKSYDLNVSGTNVVTWTFVPLLLKF